VVDLVLSPRVFFDNQHQRKKKNRERRNENENNIIEGERKSRTFRLLSLLVEMVLNMLLLLLLLLFAARRRDIRVKESFNKEIWISFVIKSALLGLYAVARARKRFGFVHAMRIVNSRHRLYRLLSAIEFYPPKYYGLFCVK
jgi:hypothetical protein